jgi:hypothetical protein
MMTYEHSTPATYAAATRLASAVRDLFQAEQRAVLEASPANLAILASRKRATVSALLATLESVPMTALGVLVDAADVITPPEPAAEPEEAF